MNDTMLNLPECLETARLILRPYRVEDASAYLDVCLRNKEHLLPYEAGNPALVVNTFEDAATLTRRYSEYWAERSVFFLGAWQKTTDDFTAQIYIGPISWELPEFAIGYFADVRHAGKGFVTEATRAAVDFCFRHLNAWRLRIECNETNTGSWKIAERCGFTREGHLRQTHRNILLADGTFSGDYIYGLLRSEWAPNAERTSQ